MNMLNHVSAAIAETNRLDAESESMIAFFGADGRTRAQDARGPRQRRRNRQWRRMH